MTARQASRPKTAGASAGKMLFAATLLLSTAAWAQGEPPAASATTPPSATAGEEQANYTMRMFLDLCLSPQADPKLVISQAEKTGFRPLRPDAAKRFLGNTSGRAWAVELALGNWALSLDEKGVCTVWARRVDAKALEEIVSSWLPSRTTGFESEQGEATVAPNGLRTLVYTIRRGTAPYAAWVLSTSTAQDAFFQGAVSLQMAK